MFDKNGVASEKRISGLIMKNGKGYINNWAKQAPKIAAYVIYLCIEDAYLRNRKTTAQNYLKEAVAFGFHKIEPKIGLLVAAGSLQQNKFTRAHTVLSNVIDNQNTNTAQLAVRSSIAKVAASAARRKIPIKVRNPKYEKASRPQERTRKNPFSVD
jgi:hypothetical protein